MERSIGSITCSLLEDKKQKSDCIKYLKITHTLLKTACGIVEDVLCQCEENKDDEMCKTEKIEQQSK